MLCAPEFNLSIRHKHVALTYLCYLVGEYIGYYHYTHSGCVAMWVTIAQAFVYYGILMASQISLVHCHVPNYVSTPANKVEQYCLQSDQCSHDTIAVCGRMAEEKRSFLDLCDLMEYACDTNLIFVHIDDEPGCPAEKEEEE